MKYAFDIDGTVGAWPRHLGEMMLGLKHLGHRVVVLTGNTRYEGDAGLRVMTRIGLTRGEHYDELMVVPGANLVELAEAKARYLLNEGFDVFVDDYEPYCSAVRELNKNILILKVFQ